MRYLGGKARIARELSEVVLAHTKGKRIWEPFVGGANMTPHLRSVLCSDVHPALIAMYKALARGWLPPEHVTEAQYQAARRLPDSNPLKAWCGFACSFGGKWFGGYARQDVDAKHPTNTPQPGARAELIAQMSSFKRAQWHCWPFERVPVDPTRASSLALYCDPPYAGTTEYEHAFNTRAFWRRCALWQAAGYTVLVSEYQCPLPHRILWERHRDLPTGVKHGNTTAKRKERLFQLL